MRATAFPRQIPEGSLQSVCDYLSGKNTDKWVAAEAAYDVLGFALYTISGGPHPVGSTGVHAGAVPDQKTALNELQVMLTQARQISASPPPSPATKAAATIKDAPAKDVAISKDEPQPQGAIINPSTFTPPSWLLPFILQLLRMLTTT